MDALLKGIFTKYIVNASLHYVYKYLQIFEPEFQLGRNEKAI